MAVRTMLFSGCCAVSEHPAVCAWKRNQSERGFCAPNRSRSVRAQMRRAARYFATSSNRSLCAVKEETESRRKLIDMQSALDGRLDVCQPVGKGERQFLGGSCACFTDVIAADRYRIPLWHMAGGELNGIDDQTHRWFGREDILVLGDVFLQNIVLKRAAQLAQGMPRFSATTGYIAQIIAAGELIVIEVLI